MIPEHCPVCDAPIEQHKWDWDAQQTFEGTWLTKFRNGTTSCARCGRKLRAVEPDDATPPVIEADQVMVAGRDYDMLFQSYRAKRFGLLPMHVFWWWSPLKHDIAFNTLIANQINAFAHTRNRSTVMGVIVVQPGVEVPGTLMEGKIDGIYRIRSHMLSDARGPYPSLKAEDGIRATFTNHLQHIYHYWPSFTLPPNDFRNLGDTVDLVRLWTRYSRYNIPVTVRRTA